MPFDQNNLPEWNATGVEPPQSKKDNGWGPGEKPPADWFNWFFSKTYNALKSLFDNAQHKEEKGQPGGYAALNADGKVVNADGSLPGGVTSVNNKTGAVTLSATDVGAETPSGAQAKADQAEQNAKAYLDSQKGQHGGVATLGPDGKVPTEQLSSDAATKDELTHLNLNVIDMAVELETLKGATLNGVTANIFIETFQTLDDINLMNGTYDSTNKRLVL